MHIYVTTIIHVACETSVRREVPPVVVAPSPEALVPATVDAPPDAASDSAMGMDIAGDEERHALRTACMNVLPVLDIRKACKVT